MVRTIRRRTVEQFRWLLDHYLSQRMLRERCEGEEKKDKGDLLDAILSSGEDRDGGHRALSISDGPTYVTPKGDEKVVAALVAQRRVSQNLNEPMTMMLLESKGLVERCTETITVLSEDKVLAANYEGLITDDELKGLYSESESYAFIMEYE